MLIIGHRGAAGYEPENTIKSFTKAIEIGAKMIEFDVQLCKSGEVVVIHDFNLERTTNGNGLVLETPFTELQKLDAGSGQLIPTLADVLKTIDKKVIVNIELKGNYIAHPTAKIIKSFIKNENWQKEDFLVSSFHHKELLLFHKLMPEIKTGLLYEQLTDNFLPEASALGAFSINTDFTFLDKKTVDKIHQHHYRLFAYTVNSKEDKRRMQEIGVDGIFTDFPNPFY